MTGLKHFSTVGVNVPARSLAMALPLSLTLLTGCGSSSTASAPPPLTGPVPVITSVDQITRPISEYLPQPSDVQAVVTAGNVLNERCMAAFGLPAIASRLTGLDAHGLRVATAHSRLYGFFDPAVVSTAGYDMVQVPPDPEPAASSAAASGQTAQSSQTSQTAQDSRLVEIGQDSTGKVLTTYAGKPIPSGGCKAQAEQGSGGPLPDLDPAGLPDGGPHLPVDDPRVVEVTKKWSGCMADKGFSVKTPFDAMSGPIAEAPIVDDGGHRKAVHSERELAQAQADIACKESTNLIGIDVAVQAAYDRAYIDSHTAALAASRQQLQERLHTAAQISSQK